jgi:hypothetical protein
VSQPTHPQWCEPSECGPLSDDNPFGATLHRGATVILDYGPRGALDVGLLKSGDEATTVSVAGQILTPADARRLADLLDRLADLAAS